MNAVTPSGSRGSVARRRRSTLFVGGLVIAEGLVPALASGADVVCIDLEDAVPPDRKGLARAALMQALDLVVVPASVLLSVRINWLRSREGIEDVQTILANPGPIGALLVPKPDTAEELRGLGDLVDESSAAIELHAIIETPLALEAAPMIARAHPRLVALYFGGFDLSTALGCAMDWEALLYARARVVHAAAIGGIEAVDAPWQDVDDLDGLKEDADRARRLGMTGKVTKTVAQVAPINAAFSPRAAELERARRILAQFDRDPGVPLLIDGKLIELPTVKRLRRMVEQHG